MDPKKTRMLTEEMPETPDELEERDLHLHEGEIKGQPGQVMTEQEPGLLTED